MFVNGCDCSLVIKTAHKEIDIPYSDETIREAVSILQEEASIEGNGVCRGLRKVNGTTGCIVTPLTIGNVLLLLYLALGKASNPVFVSGTRNVFQFRLDNVPAEDTEHFDVIQDRGDGINGAGKCLYEGCRIQEFELRIMRRETLKLKLEIYGDHVPRVYPYLDNRIPELSAIERFSGDYVSYNINGQEYQNIYGITLVSNKKSRTKTELWIKRALVHGVELPAIIDEMIITAQLLRDRYEDRYYGTFQITLKRLVLVSDETEINAVDSVMGPVRYFINGGVSADVFNFGDEVIS